LEAIPPDVLKAVIDLGWDAAWIAANNFADYKDDEEEAKLRFEERSDWIKWVGYFDENLVNDMKWCARNLAWYHVKGTYNFGSFSESDLNNAL